MAQQPNVVGMEKHYVNKHSEVKWNNALKEEYCANTDEELVQIIEGRCSLEKIRSFIGQLVNIVSAGAERDRCSSQESWNTRGVELMTYITTEQAELFKTECDLFDEFPLLAHGSSPLKVQLGEAQLLDHRQILREQLQERHAQCDAMPEGRANGGSAKTRDQLRDESARLLRLMQNFRATFASSHGTVPEQLPQSSIRLGLAAQSVVNQQSTLEAVMEGLVTTQKSVEAIKSTSKVLPNADVRAEARASIEKLQTQCDTLEASLKILCPTVQHPSPQMAA